MRKLNRQGFTLIELLAVITILGILMIVAIPAVSRTIENSRKNTFLSTAKQYANEVKTQWAADNITCGSVSSSGVATGAKYNVKIKSGCDAAGACSNAKELVDQGGKSSWGNAEVQGFVVIDVDANFKTKYYVQLIDSANRGIKYDGTESDNLTKAKVALASGVTYANAQTANLPTSTDCTVG